MARRPPPAVKHPAALTPSQLQAGIDRLGKLVERIRQFDPQSITEQYNIPHVQQLSAAIDDALVRTFGSETLDYDRYRHAVEFDNGPHNYAYEVPIQNVHQSLARSKANNIALLEQAIESLKERLAEASPQPGELPASSEGPPSSSKTALKRVFVVHGHGGAEHAVAGFLRKLGLEPVILHEKANEGRTIIEKFEAHSEVGFAVVLITPDDVGGLKEGPQRPRARQNVILELGYFVGRLGRKRVCPLIEGDLELPSDVLGVAWVELDRHEGWHIKLAKELQAAGYEFDFNKAISG